MERELGAYEWQDQSKCGQSISVFNKVFNQLNQSNLITTLWCDWFHSNTVIANISGINTVINYTGYVSAMINPFSCERILLEKKRKAIFLKYTKFGK